MPLIGSANDTSLLFNQLATSYHMINLLIDFAYQQGHKPLLWFYKTM